MKDKPFWLPYTVGWLIQLIPAIALFAWHKQEGILVGLVYCIGFVAGRWEPKR